ncbi:unnamed protein product, partial [Symbiodinium sp. CCMP2456]
MPPPWGEPAPRSEDSESGVPTRELSTKLEPNLLRGVPLHVALTGWGRHWKNSENGMFTLERGPQGEAKRYELSYPTASLDAFLSHDWASNARLKVLSLVIIYNSRAAFLSCLAVSILVGVLRAEGLLPSEIWMATFGHLSFYLVLALWQRIRMLFCRPQLVFLDKLCISQQDEQLKQAGILGIAGFLMASRKLIVLWSPRTFLRVWCGFEIGTFLRDRQRRIQIMPLKTGSLLLLGSLCWHVLSLCFHVFSKSEDALLDFKVNFNVLALVSALMTLVFALVLPLVYAIGIELMRELAGLPQQLAQFRMQDATCFCCSNGHAHPQTGAPIPCDRQLVFKLLHKWYGRDEDGAEFMSEDALESFNVMVRKQLAPRVVSGLGASMLPLPYTVFRAVWVGPTDAGAKRTPTRAPSASSRGAERTYDAPKVRTRSIDVARGITFNGSNSDRVAIARRGQAAQRPPPVEDDCAEYSDRFLPGYEKTQLLGRGACAVVWLAVPSSGSRTPVAIKQVAKGTTGKKKSDTDAARKEILFGSYFFEAGGEPKVSPKQNPGIAHIAKLLDYVETKRDIWMVM